MKSSLQPLLHMMSCIIDFEESTKNERFVVKAGFIPGLDESKEKTCRCIDNEYYLLPIKFVILEKSKVKNIFQLLEDIAFHEINKLPSYIKKCSVCKVVEIGYLLCIPFWKSINEMTEHDFEIQNLEFKVI